MCNSLSIIFFIYNSSNVYMRLFILTLSIIVCPNILGQTISLPIAPLIFDLKNINQFDSLGKKNGYWCEVSDDIVSLCPYAGGIKNGFAQIYRKSRLNQYHLEASGFYCNNVEAYQWLFFYDNGMLATSQTKIEKNSNFLKEAQCAGFYNPNSTLQCYIKNYDINGKIESEGWCIYQDDVEAYGVEVGIWKYYSSQGIKIVNKSLELEY